MNPVHWLTFSLFFWSFGRSHGTRFIGSISDFSNLPFFFALVSIHPMFLFIITEVGTWIFNEEFQYIPCSYLSGISKLVNFIKNCFNTSHVPIYPATLAFLRLLPGVSIHPMFLFIEQLYYTGDDGYMFQYIPCSYLSHNVDGDTPPTKEFQYIPCSYLSLLTHSCFSAKIRFNTSHVPIYQITVKAIDLHLSEFQYIPCSYLSRRKLPRKR